MEESIFKDKRYLIGVLTGFVLAGVVMVGIDRYQENPFFGEKKVVQNEEALNPQTLSNSDELKERIKNEVNEIQKGSITINQEMTPETPHSPELQRLDLILRETGRMIERMEKDIAKINGTQTATVSQ